MKKMLMLFICFTAFILKADDKDKELPVQAPNILFIIADDIGREMFGAYGSDYVETPNFDRLAKQGILFTNAFTTNGKCAPSRASILTGRHFFQLGSAACHMNDFPAELKTFPDVLAGAGYFCGFTGKGWAPGRWRIGGRKTHPNGKPFSKIMYADGYKSRVGFREELNLKDYKNVNMRTVGKFTQEQMRELVFSGNVWNTDYSANFDHFLKEKPAKKAFCFWYGSHDGHRPWLAGAGKKYKKNSARVKVPPYYPNTEIVRNYILDIAVEAELFDAQIGEAVALLKKHKLYENTVIVITSDNGTDTFRGKGDTYPVNMNMPLAIIYPGAKKSFISKAHINFSDFAPTFLDIAGIKAPASMTGRSFKALLENKPYRDDNIMFCGRETYGKKFTYPSRALLKDGLYYIRNYYHDRFFPMGKLSPEDQDEHDLFRQIMLMKNKHNDNSYFRLCFERRPYEELYDIKSDPFCIKNLAANPEYARRKSLIAKALTDKLRAAKDPRELNDKETLRMWDGDSASTKK
jgi:N-sulfoglucosamine sulfohydrolase